MSDNRRIVNGNRINFSCENRAYMTNIDKGSAHGSSSTKGSVLSGPLVDHDYSLWLEHVKEKATGTEVYWLMWYDNKTGKPTIPMSGIFDKDELAEMSKLLVSLIP